MLTISLSHTSFWDHDVEGYVFFLPEGFEITGDLTRIEQEMYPHLKGILKKHKFAGKHNDAYILTGTKNDRLVQFVFVGLGAQKGSWHRELELARRSIARAIHLLKRLDVKDAVMLLPDPSAYKVTADELCKQLAIAGIMATYEFETFKSTRTPTPWSASLIINVPSSTYTACQTALNEGVIIGNTINQVTRTLADMPPNVATPSYVADEAQKIAELHGHTFTCFGREKAQELGMGGFLAVDAGSDQDGKFIVMEYRAEKENAPTIALCGKGVTFDTGGISLKPSNYMCGMKFDMSGAAAVIAALDIVGHLRPNVNVIGITPLVENMPSGKASRQDDIIKHFNGMTTEIKNTDAEGRLILSDALAYAEKMYKPDVIIDLATLTGACVVALGHFYSGLMTNNDTLTTKLQEIGSLTGDRVWPLPMDDDYKEGIKSEVADIANIALPSYSAGTIEGAIYLQNFINSTPWAHLDIAGTAHDVPGINYIGKGATGAGVRLLIEFILQASKEQKVL